MSSWNVRAGGRSTVVPAHGTGRMPRIATDVRAAGPINRQRASTTFRWTYVFSLMSWRIAERPALVLPYDVHRAPDLLRRIHILDVQTSYFVSRTVHARAFRAQLAVREPLEYLCSIQRA